jgi:hypothetical protein
MMTSTQTRYIVVALAVFALALPAAPAAGKSVDGASDDHPARADWRPGADRHVAVPFSPPIARESAHRIAPESALRESAPFAVKNEQARSSAEIASADGFDWGDAALGASAGAIVVLVALAGATAISRRRPRAA